MLEKVNRINYLIDFYEQLLTKKQKNVMELYYKENLSLGEIAGQLDISRQAVYDILSRAIRSLEKWETKLRLLENHLLRKKEGQKILDLLARPKLTPFDIEKIKEIIKRVLQDY
ncbi:MAG TPA: YlxM family DNA-binding protein [Firmicutes bacterium]|jgi:predicted DNA-binding protein YlxM (UPF0122 family)|nr:YlxM family DNA-binding protein [Bacillota bacterium]